MTFETPADLAKLQARDPRVLHRYERMRRSARLRAALTGSMAEAQAQFAAMASPARPTRKLVRKNPATNGRTKGATNAASQAARRARSYTSDADARGVAPTLRAPTARNMAVAKAATRRKHAAAIA